MILRSTGGDLPQVVPEKDLSGGTKMPFVLFAAAMRDGWHAMEDGSGKVDFMIDGARPCAPHPDEGGLTFEGLGGALSSKVARPAPASNSAPRRWREDRRIAAGRHRDSFPPRHGSRQRQRLHIARL